VPLLRQKQCKSRGKALLASKQWHRISLRHDFFNGLLANNAAICGVYAGRGVEPVGS
jgi:hypothetical protein